MYPFTGQTSKGVHIKLPALWGRFLMNMSLVVIIHE